MLSPAKARRLPATFASAEGPASPAAVASRPKPGDVEAQKRSLRLSSPGGAKPVPASVGKPVARQRQAVAPVPARSVEEIMTELDQLLDILDDPVQFTTSMVSWKEAVKGTIDMLKVV